MDAPRKAVVLAAGLATRLRPLTAALPKAMLPLWGRPLIEHTLDLLGRWGVREVLINLHHAPAPLVAHLLRRPRRVPRVDFSFEPEILGTAGALRRAAWFLDAPWFWLINADVAADLNPAPLLRARGRLRPLAALWLTDAAGPRTVEMTDGTITAFRSGRPGAAGTYTFCGLHLLGRDILDYLPRAGFASIVPAYERALAAGRRIAGVAIARSFWADAGTPAEYLALHADTLARRRAGRPGASLCRPHEPGRIAALRSAGVRLRGWYCVGHGVGGARRAVLQNSVLWDGVTLEPGARVTDAIAGTGATLGGRIRGMAVTVAAAQDPALSLAAAALGWAAAETTAVPLPPRGSDRAFTRLRLGRRTAIVVRYGAERPENELYARNAGFLAAIGVRVPAVLADLPEARLTVMEDLGEVSLLERTQGRTPAEILRAYRRVLGAVRRLHRRGGAAARAGRLRLCPPFSAAVYGYEHDLFCRHFLARLDPPRGREPAVRRELRRVAARLQMEPLCLVHRDLQSSNILWHKGEPALIDFQGMRLGSAVYDLASLLCDPYVSLESETQMKLLADYAAAARRPLPGLTEAFWWAAVERLTQAIGAFGRLAAAPATSDFARHTRPALVMLQRALAHVDNLPALRQTVRDGLTAPPY